MAARNVPTYNAFENIEKKLVSRRRVCRFIERTYQEEGFNALRPSNEFIDKVFERYSLPKGKYEGSIKGLVTRVHTPKWKRVPRKHSPTHDANHIEYHLSSDEKEIEKAYLKTHSILGTILFLKL